MMKGIRLVYTALILLTLSSCDEGAFFEGNADIPESKWEQDFQPLFETDILDTIQPYHFFLNIRHSGAYPYSNIYVFVHTDFPNGKSSKDTVELALQHDDGRWKGTGGGGLYENRYMYKYAKRFPLSGHYGFRVEQAMRDESLEGVNDIGFRLDVAKPGG